MAKTLNLLIDAIKKMWMKLDLDVSTHCLVYPFGIWIHNSCHSFNAINELSTINADRRDEAYSGTIGELRRLQRETHT
jgi:hypothetical protein